MTDVVVTVKEIAPLGGASNDGWKLGTIDAGAKAAQNDKWIVGNATSVKVYACKHDATGAAETHTVSTNEITLTSATTGAKSALIAFK